MTEADPRAEHRSIIDELVYECLEGQGTVLPQIACAAATGSAAERARMLLPLCGRS